MLQKIHAGHLGMSKCKQRAREVLFWPGITEDIQNLVKRCEPCQVHQKQQMAEPLLSHPIPLRPWQKVSTDLFELERRPYIVVVDAFSGYPEVVSLTSQTSAAVIQVMKTIFARYGIPAQVLSDNGPCYSSKEFQKFVEEWDFRHVTSSPGYPKSNGMAERAVQTVKSIIRKCKESNQDPHMGLLAYRTTPMDNGLSPAEMLMGRQLRCNLPIASDKLNKREDRYVASWKKQQRETQKYYHDRVAVKTFFLNHSRKMPGCEFAKRNGRNWERW
ncbi:uncharacterized protein K02A2.6-like [Pecten maximus]|uniref:uncharacterized protein K02A2.6-like n=1 Tax=Pecten maximus TaxID=6579 RepID=UPI00145875F2|nr:uncharacterized protein K02A2.6-like [Pecten maximus]